MNNNNSLQTTTILEMYNFNKSDTVTAEANNENFNKWIEQQKIFDDLPLRCWTEAGYFVEYVEANRSLKEALLPTDLQTSNNK